ncbi:unnamed protein product [Onchocerca flexuosa]|uniref:Uncharacterized protein n=1 Tax=Onchocerca flexuosa TaxID=387005 RepID=A0A183HNY5_9BILA|nr:unnamed protein product [Onchocerca flexuosa]
MAVFVRNDSWRQAVHPASQQLLDINDESLISRYDNNWFVFKKIFKQFFILKFKHSNLKSNILDSHLKLDSILFPKCNRIIDDRNYAIF